MLTHKNKQEGGALGESRALSPAARPQELLLDLGSVQSIPSCAYNCFLSLQPTRPGLSP